MRIKVKSKVQCLLPDCQKNLLLLKMQGLGNFTNVKCLLQFTVPTPNSALCVTIYQMHTVYFDAKYLEAQVRHDYYQPGYMPIYLTGALGQCTCCQFMVPINQLQHSNRSKTILGFNHRFQYTILLVFILYSSHCEFRFRFV